MKQVKGKKEPKRESAQADQELIKQFERCIFGNAEEACTKCPYRKTTYICRSNQLNADVLELLRRQQKRIKALEDEKAVEQFWLKATLPQAEANEMFNCGRFNDIAVGYAKLALRSMGESVEKISHLEKAMKAMFDTFDAEAARTATFVNAKGVRV